MQKESGFFQAFYDALGSLKLTVSVFLVLAVCSIIGTLFPQGLTPDEVESRFRPGVAWLVNTLGLADLYRTGWFRTLLLLLCVNLVVCSLRRLPKTLRLLRHREERIDPAKLGKFSMSRNISTGLSWQEAEPILTGALSEEFRSVERVPEAEAFAATAEKGRSSALMVYVVHLSVLVILLGALLGSIFGFKGFMNLSEGESSAEVVLYQGNQAIMLPFEVRCDKFSVTYYDNGMPREYRSDLAVVEKGKEVYKQSILVNDPMTYSGVTFYQASYGSTLKQAEVELQDRDSGKSYRLVLPFRQMVEIPGTRDRVQAFEYRQDLGRMGAAMVVVLSREGQDPSGSWILIDKSDFHGNRVQNYQIKVLGTEQSNYTGLQVKRDPGVWIVWFGFTAMLLGIGMTFYMSHRKIWIWCGPSAGDRFAKILIAGRSSKNPLAFEREFNELCERIDERLKSAGTGN